LEQVQKKVDSNQRSGSTGPVEGTETPMASTACADHVQDKPTLQQPSAKATPVKPQTCATARATTTKFTNMETRRGAAERMTKPATGNKDDSNPYSLGGAVQCSSNPAVLGGEAPDARNEQSPKKQKKTPTSPTKVNVLSTVLEGGSSQIVGPRIQDDVVAGWKRGGAKLLVLNIHGMLIECSLIAERNPNADIRSSMKTGNRRVIFRPWLLEFLRRCFINFTVAFWGSKSECYMDEVTAAVLTCLKDGQSFKPLFVWSGKDCEATDFDDGAPICWGKPLSKVFNIWPVFNLSNTVIVDHKSFRVGCNPMANVIIPTAFYVQDLGNLEDDNNYLKSCLWPLLEGFFASEDIAQFRSYYPGSFLESNTTVAKVYELQGQSGIVDFVEGEGTREPSGSATKMSPHIRLHFVTDLVVVCTEKPREERDEEQSTKGGRGKA
jgi:hypothetical protein